VNDKKDEIRGKPNMSYTKYTKGSEWRKWDLHIRDVFFSCQQDSVKCSLNSAGHFDLLRTYLKSS